MSRSGAPEYFRRDAPRQGLRPAALAVVVALGLSAPMLVLSGVAGLGGDVADAITLIACGLLTSFAPLALRSKLRTLPVAGPVVIVRSAVITLLTVSAVSTIVYLITGAISNPVDALYESVIGVSTSSLTLLDDPSQLSDAVLVWRAATQWIGALLAVCIGVGVLPFLGGSRELADPHNRRATEASLAPRPAIAVRRLAAIYSVVTAVVIVAFFAAGLRGIEAITHTFSSVSTGGFSTRAASVDAYDSRAVEVVTIIVMVGAAFSVSLAWLLWRRRFSDTRRLFELKVFGAVLVLASLGVWWRHPADGAGEGRELLDSVFTVVSLASTTGHRVDDWASWQPGLSMMLLILLIVGGMAGSVSGGLRWMRLVSLLQFMWRELQRQLHPRSVRAVKVGDALISEASVDRMHAQLVYIASVSGVGAILLGLRGTGIVGSLSLAVSALSTAGPGIADGTTIVDASDLDRWSRSVIMVLSMAGRVFIYPAFVLAGSLWFTSGRAAERRLRSDDASRPRRGTRPPGTVRR